MTWHLSTDSRNEYFKKPFIKFHILPKEIRLKIWEDGCYDNRLIDLVHNLTVNDVPSWQAVSWSASERAYGLLTTCKESNLVAKQCLTRCFGTWINLDCDTLWLDDQRRWRAFLKQLKTNCWIYDPIPKPIDGRRQIKHLAVSHNSKTVDVELFSAVEYILIPQLPKLKRVTYVWSDQIDYGNKQNLDDRILRVEDLQDMTDESESLYDDLMREINRWGERNHPQKFKLLPSDMQNLTWQRVGPFGPISHSILRIERGYRPPWRLRKPTTNQDESQRSLESGEPISIELEEWWGEMGELEG